MARFRPLAAALGLVLAAAAPATAASIAEHATTISITLVSATYAANGLDASAELRIAGDAPCHCGSATLDHSEDGEVGVGPTEAALNGVPLGSRERFDLRVGDELSTALGTDARASDFDGFAWIEYDVRWVLIAESPLLDDIELEFEAAASPTFLLHNDTPGSHAAFTFGAEGSLQDTTGTQLFGLTSGGASHEETGSHEECEGFCPGEFIPPPVVTLHRTGSPATLRFVHDASSAVRVGPLPEPRSGVMLAAGALLLTALRRQSRRG